MAKYDQFPVVYIAGPFRAPTAWEIEQNVRRAEEVAAEVARLGAVPLTPHLMGRHFHGIGSDQMWLDGTMALMLRAADAVLFLPTWEASSGARGERQEAQRAGLPVFTMPNTGAWASRELNLRASVEAAIAEFVLDWKGRA